MRGVWGPKKSNEKVLQGAVYEVRAIPSVCSCDYRRCLPHSFTDTGGLLCSVRHLLGWETVLLSQVLETILVTCCWLLTEN